MLNLIYPKPMKVRAGFTLIEISIVLVIIGLIVGGVLVGRELITAAERRRLITEKENLQTAVNTFRSKYNCLPGDCGNATLFWGIDLSCPNTPANTIAKTATCNGNNNGMIGNGWSDLEHFRFWQQLSNAGLWSGQFSGAVAAGDPVWRNEGTEVIAGANIPLVSIGGASTIMVGNLSKATTDSWFFAGEYGNYIMIGGNAFFDAGAGNWFSQAFLTPTDALLIDLKIDDGRPGQGALVTNYTAMPGGLWAPCTNALTPTTAQYDVSINSRHCNLIFARQF